MADLKKDLDDYLLLQNEQKKNFKLNIPSVNLQSSNVSGWFKRTPNPEEPDSWFQERKYKCCCPTLSRFQRIILFALCIGMGILCFSISLMYLPVLLFKARKFALLFTLGSMFFVSSFFFLWGPAAYLKHMFSRERLVVSIVYCATLFSTLYCALHLQNTPFTVVFAVGQIITLLWTVTLNIPGGSSGFSFFYKMFTNSLSRDTPLPI